MNELPKLSIFCLDKSNNPQLKQSLYNFSSRFFNDGKSLIKTIVLNKKTQSIPSALILTGDFHLLKDILTNQHCQAIKIFIFCQTFSRQTYEPLMHESKSTAHLIGLFTTLDDLKYALEDILIKHTPTRQLIRFITDNLDSYLWYDFLKETSYKINATASKQAVDIPTINKLLEYDPLITLYTQRSPIRTLSQTTISTKKLFYGNVIRKSLIEKLQSNVDNIISFNSFIQLQGHNRTLDARHQALQCCSRRDDEVSVIFELELADQPTFKIIRIFNSNDDINLWVVQLVGTHECVKLSKQYSYLKRANVLPSRLRQPEILFGQILIEMNEIDKAYEYFFQVFINQYDQLNKIYTKANQLWQNDRKYSEAIEMITTEFEGIKSITSVNKTTNRKEVELSYFESEFDSVWETPIALQDTDKINDLLAPISYRVDQILCKEPVIRQTSTVIARRYCTLF